MRFQGKSCAKCLISVQAYPFGKGRALIVEALSRSFFSEAYRIKVFRGEKLGKSLRFPLAVTHGRFSSFGPVQISGVFMMKL